MMTTQQRACVKRIWAWALWLQVTSRMYEKVDNPSWARILIEMGFNCNGNSDGQNHYFFSYLPSTYTKAHSQTIILLAWIPLELNPIYIRIPVLSDTKKRRGKKSTFNLETEKELLNFGESVPKVVIDHEWSLKFWWILDLFDWKY